MSNDIVTRLRAVLHNDRSVELMNREASDEIERLRIEALGTQRRIQDQDAIMAELWDRIHALTAERDEALRAIANVARFKSVLERSKP